MFAYFQAGSSSESHFTARAEGVALAFLSSLEKNASMDEKRKDQLRSIIGRAVDTALVPFQAAVSKSAQKAYIGTAFFAVTSIFLLFLASAAYWIFYFSYIPQVGIDRVIHLQFGNGNPSGTTTLSSSLKGQQAYDITLFLHLPQTPSNVAAGNFMVDLALLSPINSKPTNSFITSMSIQNTSSAVLARSRRPAILTYTSTLVNTAHTLTTLPWYVLGWRKESEILEIPMFEGVEFGKSRSSVPDAVKVTIEPEQDAKMQFYEAGVRIVAQLGGLRWILYHHKFISFVIFTGLFWSSSMLSMLLVWLGLTFYLSSSSPAGKDKIKKEGTLSPSDQIEGGISTFPKGAYKSEQPDSDAPFDPNSIEDLSDTSRTFPTLARGQAPLKFSAEQYRGDRRWEGKDESEKRIKIEAGEEELGLEGESSLIPPLLGAGVGAEADDEDEGIGSEWRDSGIGTSREEERREELRRRRKGEGTR